MFYSELVVLTYLVNMTLRVQDQFLSELLTYYLFKRIKFCHNNNDDDDDDDDDDNRHMIF